MKNDSDLNEYPSRRTFTKSIAATLISAPIAASVISCQTGTNRNQNTGTSPSATPTPTTTNPALLSVDECKKPTPPLEDHIPPFFIGEGGSFKIECHHELAEPDPISPPIGTRKWRYKTTGTMDKYGNIKAVQTVVESKWYLDSRFSYNLANDTNALKIWFQRWDNGTNNWKQPPPDQNSQPDILVQGKAGGSPYNSLILEVDEKFSKKTSDRKNKTSRPHKREREFGPKDDDVRIYRWAIVDKNNQVIQGRSLADEVPPGEGFLFLVTFYD